MTAIDTLVERYAAVWTEPDVAARRRQIAELWCDDAVHVIQTRQVEGHAAIAERVAGAYDDLVADKGFAFSVVGGVPDGVQAHHDAITFDVNMAPAAGGPPVWVGRMLLLLDAEGRIRRDYQFGRNL